MKWEAKSNKALPSHDSRPRCSAVRSRQSDWIDSKVRYLAIEVDDALDMAEQTEV